MTAEFVRARTGIKSTLLHPRTGDHFGCAKKSKRRMPKMCVLSDAGTWWDEGTHKNPCIIFLPKPSNEARNDENTRLHASNAKGEKYYWCCLRFSSCRVRAVTGARARTPAPLNYLVLVFIGAFDMMRGNSSSFDFYCTHTHTRARARINFEHCARDDVTLCPSHTIATSCVRQNGKKIIYRSLFIKTDNVICKWFFSLLLLSRASKSFTWIGCLPLVIARGYPAWTLSRSALNYSIRFDSLCIVKQYDCFARTSIDVWGPTTSKIGGKPKVNWNVNWLVFGVVRWVGPAWLIGPAIAMCADVWCWLIATCVGT